MDEVLFADCEGDNFLEDISTLWTIQLAEGADGEVTVYADQPNYPPISEALERMKAAKWVAFHNAFGFDFFAINKLHPGTLRREQIIDTLVLSRLMDSTAKRHALADIGEALGYPKLHFDDFSQFSEEMAVYGKRDVVILQKAWLGRTRKGQVVKAMGTFFEKFRQACLLEFQCAYWISLQEQHGFRFDYEAAQLLETELRVESLDIEKELQEVFPPIITQRVSEKQIDKATGKSKRLKDGVEIFNPGSREQIAARLITKYNWKPLEKTKTGLAKIDETILDSLPYPEATLMARYLTLGKKLGMLADGQNAWLKMAQARPNGTYYIHGRVNTLGTRTHRMSHFKPNVANADGDPRMRSLWLPDPTHYLLGVDAEGLELRELAHFLYPYDQGRYVEIVHSGDKSKGTDIHTMNMKAAGLFLRPSAKTMIYAHNYGCFDKKLGIIVEEDAKAAGMPIPGGSLSSKGAELRSKIEVGIVGLGELITKCKKAHRKHGALPGHDNRWIPSASDHSALNTLLQGNGSVVMKQAKVIFGDELEKLQVLDKVFFCANVHDEFQVSVHPDLINVNTKDGKTYYSSAIAELGRESIAKAGEALGLRCPLVGSADIGKSWAETH
jgi:DNA polymerase-1